jgi:hypothetical protein
MPTYVLTDNKKFDRELPRAGTFKGVCIGVWDLGVRDTEYLGQPRVTREVMFSWEIDQRMTQEGDYKDKRFVLSTRKFTMSFADKANLTAFVQALLGKTLTEAERKTFDLDSILGMSGAVTVMHTAGKDGNTYANIQTITPLMEGVEPLKAETDWSTPPAWIQKLIDAGHIVQDSDSDSCKLAKCELQVAKEEAQKEAVKPVAESTELGADSTAQLIAECDAEDVAKKASAEPEIPFGNNDSDALLRLRELARELKINLANHIAATTGTIKPSDKLSLEEVEACLIALESIKANKEI